MKEVTVIILLSIIFYMVFLPVGLAMKLFNKTMIGKDDKNRKTNWKQYVVGGLIDRKRYEKSF